MDRAPGHGRSVILIEPVMDWKIIAQAHGLKLSPHELDRIAGPLNALDEIFRPLAKTLTPGDEPDPELRVGEEEQ